MTNLNSYTIGEYLYNVGNQYVIGNNTLKIEAIINVNSDVYFICSRVGQSTFDVKVSFTTHITVSTTPIHSLMFHHRVLETVQPSGN